MTITEPSSREQRVTREALQAYYERGPNIRVTPLPEYGCIYVRNAKVATSTTLLWLHRIHTGDHHSTPAAHRIHGENGLPRPRDIGWDAVTRMLAGSAYRFAFVRDPIRRAESAYHSKIVKEERDQWRADLRQILGLPEDRTPTFDQFVAALELQKPIEMDPHWRPQHLNLMHPLVAYDHIGQLETFDRDLAVIREAAGLPGVPVERRNTTHRDGGGLFDGRPDLRRRVEQVYARDFELYGY